MPYTDAELLAKGYTRKQISKARQYMEEFDAIPSWQRAARRTANTIGGVADTVAAAPFLAGESAVQTVKNETQTSANRKQLQQSVASDPRQEQLYRLMTGGKQRYAETGHALQPESRSGAAASAGQSKTESNAYTDEELRAKGYAQAEIDAMRSRIAGTIVNDAVDKDSSIGYQLYKRGQDLTGAAQAGLSDLQRSALGVATSAGENLAVAGINLAAVLPVLSAQGAAESMGQSVEKGENPGTALAGGLAKFGAGWAINSVSAADLAKTMGSDYAKNTLAGRMADWVRGLSGDSALAQNYPAVANAISGGMDNAMQAFVETYADTAIDAALGNQEQAEALLKPETLLTALESGLAGGMSGALGGAVGTGLARLNDGDASLLGQAERAYYESRMSALAQQAAQEQARREARVLEPGEELPQTPAGSSPLMEGTGEGAANSQQVGKAAAQAEMQDAAAAQTPAAANETAPLVRSDDAATQAFAQADVENPVETVKTAPAAEGETADTALRETYGLREAQSLTDKQRSVQQALDQWKVSPGAAETISRNVPEGIADAQRYAAAASSLYRLGQMEDVKTFDQAMDLAGVNTSLGLNTNYVLQQPGGENALRAAFLQGQGELEAGTVDRGTLGGAVTEQTGSGEGKVYYKGSMRDIDSVGTQLIELNARGTDTDAVLKAVLQGPDGKPSARAKAYVETETARIFFSDQATDIFDTILHEDYHWYNALDQEGAAALQSQALEYLAKGEGFESVDEMIHKKLRDYAGQNLTYYEAAEELVADSWGGIFDSPESVQRFAAFQREQAQKNAGKAGTIHKMMTAVKELLTNIISRAKEVLTRDPENRAALQAKRLAAAEKRALQDAYFAHAEKAMDNLRAAKENAAALRTEGAAKERGRRFQLQHGEETLEEQLNQHLDQLGAMHPVSAITGKEIAYGSTSKENAENIIRFFESIGGKVERKGFGTVELSRKGAKATVQHGNGPLKQIAAAAIPDVIRYGQQIGFVENWKGRGYNTYTFVAPVAINDTTIYEAVIVNEYKSTKQGNKFYVHEVCGSDGSLLVLDDTGTIKQKQESADTVLKTEEGGKRPSFPAESSIAQDTAKSKENNEPVKKTQRFQLSAPVEVDGQKDLVAVHNLTEENLREALELGGMPSPSIAVVKAQEGHTKYGPISLVFGSDTIDPMVNRANRVYGSDAWTPTRPNVEYEVHADKAMELNTQLAQLSRQTAEGAFARGNILSGTLDMEASDKSPQQLAEKLAQSDAAKAAYLAERGENVAVVTKQEERFTDSQKNRYAKIMEAVGGEEALRNIMESDKANGNHEMANAVLDEVRDAETSWAMQELGWSEEKAQKKAAKLIAPMLRMRLENAYEYATTEDTGGKVVQDTEAMQKELQQKAPDAAVEAWLLPKMEKVLGKKGIYNGNEPYTRTGNRRSFAQLHNPYTLENLVNAMNQEDARGKGAWGLSANTLMSTATAEYQNLDEVRADKNRLQQMPEAEYQKLLEGADSQIEAIIQKLRQETTAHSDSSYGEREILGDILLRAAEGKRTAAAIGKAFAKEGYVISKDAARMILKLYNDVAAIPTGYFEAKPQRAVGFDEVRAAILPDNANQSLIDQLKDAGVRVEFYKAGDDAQRTQLLNNVPDVRFQLAEQADRDAKRNEQQQASRAIADKAAALDTLSQFFGITRGVKVSQHSIEELASRWTKANASRTDRAQLAKETQVLVDYLKADGADMQKAQALAETLAGEVLDGATYRNSELWDEYPELHRLEYTVNKTGQAKAELVKRYGSWSEAVAEARRHGVTLRQGENVQDGNPAESYESIVNDTRAMGGVKEGAAALFRNAAERAGVAGAASMESTEWLDILMNVHDAIKPQMMSRFADAAEYEDAKVELAGRMIGDILAVPEMTDVQAIFEGIQQHNLQVAAMAAGSEERAAEVAKGLKGVQKTQRQEFNRRLAENQRTAAGSAEVQAVTEQQQQNARAEQLLDENLETFGVDTANIGNLTEKLTVLRETYEREWKAEKKRMRAERQEMLDEIRLENRKLRSENSALTRQVKAEQKRADRAEYAQIVQEREILDWENENQRKADAWQQKQAQRNAIAQEVARQQRDEDIAVAKALAEKRVQRARDARKQDELKRSIRRNASQLNQLVLRPAPGKYVQQSLIVQAAEVAKMADLAVLNPKAVNRLDALRRSIEQSKGAEGSPSGISEDWTQSRIPEMIDALQNSLTASRNERLARLQQQLAEAKQLEYSDQTQALQERLEKRIRETENRSYMNLNTEQLQLLKAITSGTLHVIRTANKTLSLAKAEEVDAIAQKAAQEVQSSKGNRPGGKLDGLRNGLTRYNLDMLGAKRVFRMLGGYAQNGQMEKLADMLNDGQYRQTQITVEGEKLFAEVTGKEHQKEMERFAGPGADQVDVGLTDARGNAVPLTHAQLCSLYMLLQNKDSLNHLLTGGLVLPNAELYSKGDVERAYQEGQTVQLGMLQNADGTPMADTILQTVQNAMTDYDKAWCRIMKDFFNRYTANLINETSMKLLGYQRATVQNYYPIAVDKGTLATEIEGLKLDATIEGRGFMKNRVKSSKPILLEECSNVVQRSLRDTAAYAGLAAPIRDVQKVLNSGVETEDGLGILKNKIIKEQWGKDAVNYIDDLLTDLQSTQRRRSNGISRMMGRLRGNYAGAVLTVNPGVAIAQAASLPTAAAVLGRDTMAAVVPFVKNLSGKQRAALEAEIDQHGDALLAWRKRGSQRGELASIGKSASLAEKAMDKLPKALTGWINGMDEITVAALWEGSKQYVKNHAAEFAGDAAKAGSEDYWNAVNRTYQRVIEETQPNYTVMQRAGIQRNPDELVKTLTMFTTQRFQNYGILADAVGDYNAQKARYNADRSAENKTQVQRAGQQLRRAAVSQVTQTAVFALMKIGADFLLHRWDREQDENGDVTLESLLKRFTGLFTESAAGNFLFGSELYSAVDNALSGKDYDVISATNISAVNDLFGDVTKFVSEVRKDTSDMSETQLESHHTRLQKRAVNLIQDGLELSGVPAGNTWKFVEAFKAYWDDVENLREGGSFTFNSLPSSATGQYDRLYNAYANGDAAEAQAAVEKLAAMGKEDEIYTQLKRRLQTYDPGVAQAAEAQVKGNDALRVSRTREVIRELYSVLGIQQTGKADAARREAVIDCVTGAVNSKTDALLKNGGTSVTDDLMEALDSGKARDAQAEVDRLLRAGKSLTAVKSKITEVCKPDYLAGNDHDRQQMEQMLLALQDADGKALYDEKTFANWVKQAEKSAGSAQQTRDPYADLR